MKQHLILLFCLFFTLWGHAKALNIDTLFINTPRHVMPLLDQTSKMDLIDLYNGGLKARVMNLYGGETFLLKKTDTFLSLQTTDSGTWSVVLLPCSNGDTLVVCAHSVKAGGVSTELQSFNKDWTYKKVKFPAPEKESLLKWPEATLTMEQQPVAVKLMHQPVEVVLNDSTGHLSYSLNTEGLTEEELKIGGEWCSPLIYNWNGNAFVLKKDDLK